MSPPLVTPTKGTDSTNNLTTTGSKKNAGDRLLFTTVLTTQDLQQKCNNILDILKGDDERAKAKAIKDVSIIAKGLSAIETNLLETVKLNGKTYQCSKFISNMKSETKVSVEELL